MRILGGMLLVGLSGCAWQEQVARRAAQDFGCAPVQIDVVQEPGGAFARGCGTEAHYELTSLGWQFRETDYLALDSAARPLAPLRDRAAEELRCPLDALHIVVRGGQADVTGCGRGKTYFLTADGWRPQRTDRKGSTATTRREVQDGKRTGSVPVPPSRPPRL